MTQPELQNYHSIRCWEIINQPEVKILRIDMKLNIQPEVETYKSTWSCNIFMRLEIEKLLINLKLKDYKSTWSWIIKN